MSGKFNQQERKKGSFEMELLNTYQPSASYKGGAVQHVGRVIRDHGLEYAKEYAKIKYSSESQEWIDQVIDGALKHVKRFFVEKQDRSKRNGNVKKQQQSKPVEQPETETVNAPRGVSLLPWYKFPTEDDNIVVYVRREWKDQSAQDETVSNELIELRKFKNRFERLAGLTDKQIDKVAELFGA